MWCKFGHVTVVISTQRNPRTPPSGLGEWLMPCSDVGDVYLGTISSQALFEEECLFARLHLCHTPGDIAEVVLLWTALGHRGTSRMRKRTPTGPYRRPMPRVLGGWAFPYGRGTPVWRLLSGKGDLVRSGSEAGSYSRLIDFGITQL